MNPHVAYSLFQIASFLGFKAMEVRQLSEKVKCDPPMELLEEMSSLSLRILEKLEPYVIQDNTETLEKVKESMTEEVKEVVDLLD